VERDTLNPPELFDSLQYGFSQAVAVREEAIRLVLSGQVATDQQERTTRTDLAGQLEVTFDNIERLLSAAGAGLEAVTMLRIYLIEDVKDELHAVATELRRRFPYRPPASSWVLVAGLAREDWLVEVEAEASLPQR
jgi:2-iminobutanoate/2-iminopropanoate deaminase